MGSSSINCTREHLERQLRAYGEDAVADQVMALQERRLRRIAKRAMDYACEVDTPTGMTMLLDKALAMAAVEVVEGASRTLARNRRRY